MSSAERRELQWLEDIKEAIDKIQGHEQFQHGKAAFLADEHYRIWVFYFIERIGECASQLRKDFDYDNLHSDVDWKGAQAMRRYLVHRYWAADQDQVWKGVEYLPKIKSKVERLIAAKKDRKC